MSVLAAKSRCLDRDFLYLLMVRLFTFNRHVAAVNSKVVSVMDLVHFITASQKT